MTRELAVSIAAYRANPALYAAKRASSATGLFARFSALLVPGSLVLDAGCGPGRDLARFGDAGHRPIGVDLCREFSPDVVADLRALPFAGTSFGAAWACASLVHLTDRDAVVAMGELTRVTCGPVLVSVKGDGPSGWRRCDLGWRWFNTWTADRLAQAATAAGLRVGSVDTGPVWVDLWAVAG